MLVLGINAYHGDSSAAILRDGVLIAAIEEERLRRIKHWAGLPTESIRFCLQEAGIRFSELEHVAINLNPRVNHLKRLAYIAKNRPSWRLVVERLRKLGKTRSLQQSLAQAFPEEPLNARIHHVEHHLAHIASSYLCSPFRDAVNLSVDGFGDFASAAWGMGIDGRIQIDGRVYFPHSLGMFYSALTQYLGFPHYGDEYKVMGLAPYGEPVFLDKMRQIVKLLPDGTFELGLDYFRHHREQVPYVWDNGSPEVGTLFAPALEDLLGPARKKDEPLEQKHRDLARSIQAMYEEAFFHMLGHLHTRYGCDSLTLSGGCAMNSVANGKVRRMSPFKDLYIQSAAGDAGGAIGAALIAHQTLSPRPSSLDSASPNPLHPSSFSLHPSTGPLPHLSSPDSPSANRQLPTANSPHPSSSANRQLPTAHCQPTTPFILHPSNKSPSGRFVMSHAYYGPRFESADYKDLLDTEAERLAAEKCEVIEFKEPENLCRATAQAISEGKVIGWFQGRLEWGPRALGNRSILGDPRRADMKDILNQKIKRRESFRPFAPSILREHVIEWFEEEADVPFMMQVFQVRPEKRDILKATTHVDGSGRLQTVHADTNPLYYRLIQEFQKLTGVPIVLNTSFNENEPVVCHPREALDCFLRTKMDVLVLGHYLVRR